MPGNNWYQDWFNSPFYHKLYFERDDKEASSFIHNIADRLSIPLQSAVLDVACGRGRHSRILAGLGMKVTGIDIAASSIEFAKKYESDNLEFFVHDMRLPFRVNYYNYAFNLFTSFGYFKTRREHDDSIRTISSSLEHGGTLVIDYLNVHYSEQGLVKNEEKNINGTEYEIHRWQDEKHFHKRIIIRDATLPHPVEHTESVAKFSLGDFTDMLSYQRLQVQEVFGDYHLGNYDVIKKPRMIIVARKL